jgi:hypothetical protein
MNWEVSWQPAPGQGNERSGCKVLRSWLGDGMRLASFHSRRFPQRHSVATLLVLDKAGDEYNIFVFTPGLELDRVPTEKPLRSEDIRQSPELPIRWERLQSLIQKHRQESARLALGAAGRGIRFDCRFGQELPSHVGLHRGHNALVCASVDVGGGRRHCFRNCSGSLGKSIPEPGAEQQLGSSYSVLNESTR